MLKNNARHKKCLLEVVAGKSKIRSLLIGALKPVRCGGYQVKNKWGTILLDLILLAFLLKDRNGFLFKIKMRSDETVKVLNDTASKIPSK